MFSPAFMWIVTQNTNKKQWRALGRRRAIANYFWFKRQCFQAVATSLKTAGRNSAIAINICAAFDGNREPSSHSCSVRTNTPNRTAICDWVKHAEHW
jgi:hypothetical protein